MGINSKITERLHAQRGVVGTWQLVEDDCTPDQIRHAAGQLRSVHDGVLLSGHAPLTDWQRWKAGTLTAPATALSGWSGAALAGFRDKDRFPTTVTRPGSGGPRTFGEKDDTVLGSVHVSYTERLGADLVEIDEISSLCAARTVLDLVLKGGPEFAGRLVRDALRLKTVEAIELRAQLARHHGRPGTKRLRDLVDEYEPLDLARGRSDAEALAMALLRAARVELPALNVEIAGGEADLVDAAQRLIVELDGPQYHRFLTRDAHKQARWEQAGWVVRRLPTDDVYDQPHLLLSAWTVPVMPAERALILATRGPADVLPRLEAPLTQLWRAALGR